MRVLVTDGGDRAALATCRALARAGHTVSVAACSYLAPARWSRACAGHLRVPSSLVPELFASAVADALERDPHDAVVPATDAALLALSRVRSQLPPVVGLALPRHEDVLRSLDKTALVEESERVGLSVLEGAACSEREQAFAAAAGIGYPVVVKPRRSVVGGSTARRAGACVVCGPAELAVALDTFGGFALVQRYEQQAAVLSIGGVATARGLVAVVAARWARRWPPLDGAASFAETVAAPPALLERIEDLLRRLRWCGIFELELLELRSGGFAPIDFNPRPFGWMTLALRAGANLPAIWLECLRGAEPTRAIASPGIRYRWEEGDLRHLLWQLRRRRLRAAASALTPRRRVVHAHFELRDSAPFAAVALDLAQRSLRRTVTMRARARAGVVRQPVV